MSKTIVALDLGTTSCRALVFGLDGKVLGTASRAYPLQTPKPGWVEQDPRELLSAADAVVPEAVAKAGVAPADVLGVVLCTYMHSLIAVGPTGQYLSGLVTWADTRSAAQVDQVRSQGDWFDLYARTGCPPHTMYPLYKFLWFKENQPGLLVGAHRWASIKELLIHHWTGKWALDYNLATGTGLLNCHTLDWDPGALALAGVRRDQLSDVVPNMQTFPLTSGRLGLLPGTPVVAGAGDGVLSSLGCGAIEPNVVAAMVGTSGAVRACVPEPVADPKARVFCYYLDKNRWILGGSLNNGGIAMQWARGLLYPGSTNYDELMAEAATVPPGSGSLLFLPYLAGERSPGFNARARGVWFGLGLEHGRPHMARSVVEAIAYRLYSVLGPIEELTGTAREIRATGGFARSELSLQVCADVFGREVAVPDEKEGSALGAFVLGAVALGVADDLSHVHRFIDMEQRVAPSLARHAIYEEMFGLYRQVFDHVQNDFYTLAAIRERSV
ncbi:MAG TPA: gluconokinase [Symbiobacteriaceae bacterium]|nr:gluconokinase [Symbiobacteriaceae bacterium]